MVGDFSVPIQRGEGKIKKGLFTREKSGHHVSDDIASCFYPVIFSDDLWLECSCLISWGFFEKKTVMILYLND